MKSYTVYKIKLEIYTKTNKAINMDYIYITLCVIIIQIKITMSCDHSTARF